MIDKLLSIIVPVYNAENTINRCIDSVINQTYTDFELVLIDDGSSDNSFEICNLYSLNDSRIKCFHIDNCGPGLARNFGLSKITGRYLAFLDSDDYVEPDMYSTLINEMVDASVPMVICNWFIHNSDGTSRKSDLGEPGLYKASEVLTRTLYSNLGLGGGFPWNRVFDWGYLCEKSHGGIIFKDLTAYEDRLWLLEALSYCSEVKLLSYCGYHYTISEDGLSKTFDRRRLKSYLEADLFMINNYNSYFNDYVKQHFSKHLLRYLWVSFRSDYYDVLKEYLPLCRPYINKKDLSIKQQIEQALLIIITSFLTHAKQL